MTRNSSLPLRNVVSLWLQLRDGCRLAESFGVYRHGVSPVQGEVKKGLMEKCPWADKGGTKGYCQIKLEYYNYGI